MTAPTAGHHPQPKPRLHRATGVMWPDTQVSVTAASPGVPCSRGPGRGQVRWRPLACLRLSSFLRAQSQGQCHHLSAHERCCTGNWQLWVGAWLELTGCPAWAGSTLQRCPAGHWDICPHHGARPAPWRLRQSMRGGFHVFLFYFKVLLRR